MKDIERYKLEKKYVPLVDKYSIILFILGLGSVALIGSNKISITLVMSYFLVKVGVYVYTTQLSVPAKLKEKQRTDKLTKDYEDEIKRVEKELDEKKIIEGEIINEKKHEETELEE